MDSLQSLKEIVDETARLSVRVKKWSDVDGEIKRRLKLYAEDAALSIFNNEQTQPFGALILELDPINAANEEERLLLAGLLDGMSARIAAFQPSDNVELQKLVEKALFSCSTLFAAMESCATNSHESYSNLACAIAGIKYQDAIRQAQAAAASAEPAATNDDDAQGPQPQPLPYVNTVDVPQWPDGYLTMPDPDNVPVQQLGQ